MTRFAMLLAAVLIAVAPAQRVCAESSVADDVVTWRIDWASGVLLVTVERSVDAANRRSPAAVSQTQRSIRRDAPRILFSTLAGIQLDSLHTVGGFAAGREGLVAGLERAARRATAVDASASRDLATARVDFSIDLYRDLVPELAPHTRPAPVEARLGWVAHTDYTGILIYAAEELPLFGTDETALVQPALFPGIHYLTSDDRLLYRLAGQVHAAPDHLTSGGFAAYTSDPEAAALRDRLGSTPLRILAVAAFGSYPVDVVITEQDARRIMASENNRSLVRDGRVVIVVDSARTAGE